MGLEQFRKSEIAMALVREYRSQGHDQMIVQMIDMLLKFKAGRAMNVLILESLTGNMFVEDPMLEGLSLDDLPEIARIVQSHLK